MINIDNLSLLDNQFLNDELDTEPSTQREEEANTVLEIAQDLQLNMTFAD